MKFLYLIGIMMTSYAVKSQSCDPSIKAKPGLDGYQKREGGDWCEGIFTQNVSGAIMDIISVTKGRLRYYLNNEEKIVITGLNTPQYNKVNVRGVNYGMNDSYRFDIMNLPLNISKKIPVRTIIAPYKITDNKLGIYGFQEEAGSMLYMPVTVSSESYKNKVLEDNYIFLKLISNVPIEKIIWRYGVFRNKECVDFTEPMVLEGSSFNRMVPILFKIPLTRTNTKLCVEVKYKSLGQEWNVKSFNVLMP